MNIPGIHRMRNTESTRATSEAEKAENASTKKSLGKGLKKFGTQIKHSVQDAMKNVNSFSQKLSAKIHDVPSPARQEAAKWVAEAIKRQDAAFQNKFNGHDRMERPSAHAPSRTEHQQAHRPQQPVRTPQESASAQWARTKFERGQREKEVNLLKFDMLRRHPGEIQLDESVIPHWDTSSRDKHASFEKAKSAAEMKLSRYIHGDTSINIKNALREIRSAEDGMQTLLQSVKQREKAEASKKAEIKTEKHTSDSEGPVWSLAKIPPWNRELKTRVDRLMDDYYRVADYDDDYETISLQQQLAKIELDEIFSDIEKREKAEARFMRNFNAS